MVLTTSNITEAIDLAFVDRADIKAWLLPLILCSVLNLSTFDLYNDGLLDWLHGHGRHNGYS